MPKAHQLDLACLHPLDVGGNVLHRTDLVEHAQHFFIRSAMQRTGQSRRSAGHRQVRIGLRAPDDAHGAGAAILFVVGVQNEQDIQRAGNHRARHILRLGHAPQHVHEVFGVAEVVIGINIRMPAPVPIGKCRQRCHLGDDAHNLLLPVYRIVNVSSPRDRRWKAPPACSPGCPWDGRHNGSRQ